ncbi:MAG: hypothetical protein WC943_13585 [Elusimicrobiota bacterium]|jgi:hypothetical protein
MPMPSLLKDRRAALVVGAVLAAVFLSQIHLGVNILGTLLLCAIDSLPAD